MMRFTSSASVQVHDVPGVLSVTVNTVRFSGTKGVPSITPVVGLSWRPDGKDGSTEKMKVVRGKDVGSR